MADLSRLESRSMVLQKETFEERKTKAKLPENARTKLQPEQCQKCLRNFHLKKSCLACLSKCRKCLKIGHWAQACKSSKAGKLFETATNEGNFFLAKQD